MQAVSEPVTLICLASGSLCVPEGQAELLVKAITLTSVAAAGGFGLLGLFTDYKDDNNRVTIWGRIAAVGIVASALFSILLSTLQDRLQSQAATRARLAAEAKRQIDEDNFNRQLGELATVKGDLGTVLGESRTVRDELKKSIVTQQTQLGLANRAVDEIRLGANRSERNTERLLRSVWDSSEQVSARDITIRIATRCNLGIFGQGGTRPAQPKPRPLFKEPVELEITAYPPAADAANSSLEVANNPIDRSSGYGPALWKARTEVHAIAAKPRIFEAPLRAYFGGYFGFDQDSVFTELTTKDTNLNRRSSWNGIRLDLQIIGHDDDAFYNMFLKSDIVAEADGGFIDQKVVDLGFMRAMEDVVGKAALNYGERLLPCTLKAEVYLGNRVVATGAGQLAVWGTGTTIAVMPPMTVAADTFPVYKGR